MRGGAPSDFLIVSDHAGRAVPRALADLGLTEAELTQHIGWDIGAAGLTRGLAQLLNATAILQRYSRLVIDCNRRPGHPTSITPRSDGIEVPGNQNLPDDHMRTRVTDIFEPYHGAIAAEIDGRIAAGRRPAIISVHSFTPSLDGAARPWQAGVLHNRDPRLAHAVASALRAQGFYVGDNEPYALTDWSDYTIPVHAERRGLPYLELEIRQDLIAGTEGQQEWAERMAEILSGYAGLTFTACDIGGD